MTVLTDSASQHFRAGCVHSSPSVGRSVPGHDASTSYKKYVEVLIAVIEFLL